MDIAVASSDGMSVVTIVGSIDGATAPQAQERTLPLIDSGCRLALDMSGVDFMSSAGLRMMLVLFRRVSGVGGRIVLTGLSEEIKDTMALTGFLDFFTTCDSLEAGLQALKG
jgi:anti-sigma B factor antagonist